MTKFSVDRELRRAQVSERSGDPNQAKRIYASILQKFPNNARAKNALAILENIQENGNGTASPDVRINELTSLCRGGNFSLVILEASALLEEFPSSFQLWNLVGIASNGLGRVDEAERGFRKASELRPDLPDSYGNLGAILRKLGRLDEAIECFQQALRIKGDLGPIHHNLGNALKDRGRLDEAIESYRRALQIKPEYAEAHLNLGNALKEQGRLAEAIDSYRRVLQIRPDNADCYNNIGNVLKDQGEIKKAKDYYERALQINPDHTDAHNNLGVVLVDEGRPGEAIECYQRSLRSNPHYAKAHYNLGNALKDQGRLDEALDSYRRALELDPDNAFALAEKLQLQSNICDWRAFNGFADISGSFGMEGNAASPFATLVLEDDPERQAKRSRVYARQTFRQEALPFQPRQRSRPIRVGYFSADFHDHATLHLMSGLLREHDRNRFEIHGYSYGATRSGELRDRAAASMACFTDVKDLSDQAIVDLARSNRLDIAIDLKGYTRHTRSRLFAYRLAPIQVSYLGYPGTMAADFIDFMIADPVVVPDAEREFYTEKLIYMPNTYQPNDNQREIARTETRRADFGLPETGFVFCCFNQNYKITPREFEIWMRLLRNVDGSVLWLLRSNSWAEANLRREAGLRSVDPDRLVFAQKLPHAEHLARHKHADLFIDTFNVNAHTTASDALWAGLPVVTKAGRQFAARVAASLLTAVGLPELITETEEDYETLILHLATRPDSLAAIRAKLANNRLSQPLFDTVRYARDFERALEAAYEEQLQGRG